jgi:MFS superfamily sulfate permease-like transporter
MKRLITYNWLILCVSALLTGIFISVFEHFWAGKAYMYFMLAALFGWVYYRQRKGA